MMLFLDNFKLNFYKNYYVSKLLGLVNISDFLSAKEVYDNAVKEGHTAILGSEDRFSGDLLHLALGNLPKGEFANLQLKMVQELPLKIDGAITQDDGMNFDHDWSFQIYYQTVHKPHCLQMAGDRTSSGLMKDDVLMLNLFPEVPLEDYIQVSVTQRAHCKKALELQKSMDADMGGTEIFEALRHVYSKELVPGYPRQIIVLTDGEVWNIDQLIELIQRHADDTRVFSVGIGDGASTALVEGMAMAGKGRCEMVADESQFQTRIESVKVGWKIGEDQFNCELKEDDCKSVHDSNFSFHRLAAKAQLIQWLKEDDDNLHEDIINLSISSSVVCKLTSFVGFDQDNKVIKEKAKEYPTYPAMDRCCMMSVGWPKGVSSIKKNKSATVALRSYDQALKLCADDSENFVENEDEEDESEFLACGFVDGGNEPLSEEDDALVEQEKDTLVDLISFQQFDGSWSLNDCLNLLNIDENFCKTIRSKVSLDDICLGTALILAYLELKFDSRKEEWKIVALKGHKFLKVNKIDSADVVQKCSLELKDKI
ncbi:von Willebrand factor A domain-containing protein 5A [Armadillidium vulgare]|nr:von Willebrand factor A domain-containing protein 5A [Armadillidium vulgare]